MNTRTVNMLSLSVSLALFSNQMMAQDTSNQAEPKSKNLQQVEDKLFEKIVVTGSRLDRASSATGLPLILR